MTDPRELEVLHIVGAPPTIVLLHEGLGCVAAWRDFPGALAERTGCAVLAYSRRGYGTSPPCELPRPASYMHDEANGDLSALIAAKIRGPFVLLGHSDGASIATIYAANHPEAPLDGLILIAPHFFVEDLTLASIRAAGDAYRAGDLRERLVRYHGQNVDCAFYGWHDAWLSPAFQSWHIRAELEALCVPHLLIQGRNDMYGSPAQAEAARHADVRWIEDCGHSPHREAPDATLRLCAEFITRLRGDG